MRDPAPRWGGGEGARARESCVFLAKSDCNRVCLAWCDEQPSQLAASCISMVVPLLSGSAHTPPRPMIPEAEPSPPRSLRRPCPAGAKTARLVHASRGFLGVWHTTNGAVPATPAPCPPGPGNWAFETVQARAHSCADDAMQHPKRPEDASSGRRSWPRHVLLRVCPRRA